MSNKEEPKLVDGYKHNPLPNRKTRRMQAKQKNREAWGQANRQWAQYNNQTIKDVHGHSGETDGRKETN